MFLNRDERKLRLDELNSRIKGLEESYMTCKRCDGTGLVTESHIEENEKIIKTWDGITYCDTCEGWGTVDWINFVKKGMDIKKFYIGKKKQNDRNI